MKPHAFNYERVADTESVCERLQDDAVRLMGGGQSLGPMLNLRLARPATVLDISALAALRGYAEDAAGLIIGSAVTHAEIEDGLLPDTTRGILPRIAHGIAYRAVRSRGTIGGSLAHADPAADWVSSLCALDAQVILQSVHGQRRVRLQDFVLGAFQTALAQSEMLLAVHVPAVPPGSRFGYFKTCRKTGELALAIGAVFIHGVSGAQRAVLGATGGRPAVLEGEHAGDSTRWEQALMQAVPGMDRFDLNLHVQALHKAYEASDVL